MRNVAIGVTITALLFGAAASRVGAIEALPTQAAGTTEKLSPPSLLTAPQAAKPSESQSHVGRLQVSARRALREKLQSLADSPERSVRQQPTVVCGMMLVPADPAMDAAIRHTVPENGPTFAIRRVQPPVCRR
jgi:hypothetical protein